MKAAIISLGSKSSIMTAEAMKKYFNQVDMIQLRDIEVSLGKEAQILYAGEPLQEYDCVYVKGSFRYANLLCSIASMLEKKVPYMPFPASAFTVVHNKLLTHLILEQENIPMPKTYISSTVDTAKELLKKVNFPIVMKFPEGTQGKGVMFADSISSGSSLLDALSALNQPFIIQEYVETGGTDIRALVVGDKVVASMRRRAQTEEKRANIHAGGIGEPVLLSPQAAKLAVNTAKTLGADICGVDILEGPLGPVVIEANISPGLQGLSAVSTIDIADEIARHLFHKTEEIVKGINKKAHVEVMKQIEQPSISQEVISSLTFRGQRILLPEFAARMAGFSDEKEYTIKARKGKLEIEEFNL
tara:strand:+ start:41213 stop:42289 length:1077 start_codon:yes stop_codon:yes gene_type:complete